MAVAIVAERLSSLTQRERENLALQLAETCYECFRIEEDFRDLVDKDPNDLDGILTALVNLQIGFDHIRDHFAWLKRPLDNAIKRVDDALEKLDGNRPRAMVSTKDTVRRATASP